MLIYLPYATATRSKPCRFQDGRQKPLEVERVYSGTTQQTIAPGIAYCAREKRSKHGYTISVLVARGLHRVNVVVGLVCIMHATGVSHWLQFKAHNYAGYILSSYDQSHRQSLPTTGLTLRPDDQLVVDANVKITYSGITPYHVQAYHFSVLLEQSKFAQTVASYDTPSFSLRDGCLDDLRRPFQGCHLDQGLGRLPWSWYVSPFTNQPRMHPAFLFPHWIVDGKVDALRPLSNLPASRHSIFVVGLITWAYSINQIAPLPPTLACRMSDS